MNLSTPKENCVIWYVCSLIFVLGNNFVIQIQWLYPNITISIKRLKHIAVPVYLLNLKTASESPTLRAISHCCGGGTRFHDDVCRPRPLGQWQMTDKGWLGSSFYICSDIHLSTHPRGVPLPNREVFIWFLFARADRFNPFAPPRKLQTKKFKIK